MLYDPFSCLPPKTQNKHSIPTTTNPSIPCRVNLDSLPFPSPTSHTHSNPTRAPPPTAPGHPPSLFNEHASVPAHVPSHLPAPGRRRRARQRQQRCCANDRGRTHLRRRSKGTQHTPPLAAASCGGWWWEGGSQWGGGTRVRSIEQQSVGDGSNPGRSSFSPFSLFLLPPKPKEPATQTIRINTMTHTERRRPTDPRIRRPWGRLVGTGRRQQWVFAPERTEDSPFHRRRGGAR